MIIEIVGIQDVKYTSKKTGNEVRGQKLFFTFPDENIRGVGTDNVFLNRNNEIIPEPALPATAELFYNKYGNVDEIRIVK